MSDSPHPQRLTQQRRPRSPTPASSLKMWTLSAITLSATLCLTGCQTHSAPEQGEEELARIPKRDTMIALPKRYSPGAPTPSSPPPPPPPPPAKVASEAPSLSLSDDELDGLVIAVGSAEPEPMPASEVALEGHRLDAERSDASTSANTPAAMPYPAARDEALEEELEETKMEAEAEGEWTPTAQPKPQRELRRAHDRLNKKSKAKRRRGKRERKRRALESTLRGALSQEQVAQDKLAEAEGFSPQASPAQFGGGSGVGYGRARERSQNKSKQRPKHPRAQALERLDLRLSQPKPSRVWPKQGYFENSYLGGDLAFESALMALPTRTYDALRSPGASLKVGALDAPSEDGMGLSVALSEVSASGPRRVLMQVALQGSERYGWRRPPLSVVVVLDPTWLAQSSLDLTDTLTPLLNTLSPVDRVALFSSALTIHELKGVEVARDAMIRATEHAQGELSSRARAAQWLPQQLRRAGEALEQAAADPHRAPGAQAVLLLCAEGCVSAREALTREAHALNLSGVLTTVMSAPSVTRDELWRIASAGHGGSWSLSALNSAELARVTTGELERFSRVVARLLRLSVRFPKGVDLLNIIGSRMLSQTQAKRVKAREVAMDKRLSARLGIKSDRGEDDEGVQVVIPAFYGGDRHFITFELWVEGPGEVAEVTLKYKDMVRSLNATASVSAQLSSLPLKRGPAQEELLYVAAQQTIGVELKALGDSNRPALILLLSELAELNPASSLLSSRLFSDPRSGALLGAALLGRGSSDPRR